MKTLRAWLRNKLLTPQERMTLATLAEPMRWQPDNPFTPTEAEQWGALLRQPLLLKIDVAMINMAQQEAQRAISAPSEDTHRMAGYALGIRAGWQIAKSFSTLTAAEGGAHGEADHTAAVLEQLTP